MDLRGIERGIEDGNRAGRERRLTLRLMEAKFGPLHPDVKQQIEALSPDALTRLQLNLLNAQSLGELRLGD